MKKLSLFLAFVVFYTTTQAAHPTFRQFVHNNADKITGVICLAGATAACNYTNNPITYCSAKFIQFLCATSILFHPATETTIKENLAAPKQMFLLRLGKLASLTYCCSSMRSTDSFFCDLVSCLCITPLVLATILNTLGIPSDIYRVLKTI